ncbi:hypothetical protein K9N50_07065 [bacterium]|nr:hypothetical protein [bacterium]
MRFITITLIVCISLVNISCSPKLSRSQKKWKIYHRNVDGENIGYPFEVIEDGYKLIAIYKTKKPIEYSVEWGWKLLLRNVSRSEISVGIRYKLLDKDDFVVASDYYGDTVAAGDTLSVQNTSKMRYEKAKMVKRSVFELTGFDTETLESLQDLE